jgi:hypothetical protein
MREIMNSDQFEKTLDKLADEVLTKNTDFANIAIIGIHTRGVSLAKRLKVLLEKKTGLPEIPFGTIDLRSIGMMSVNFMTSLRHIIQKFCLKSPAKTLSLSMTFFTQEELSAQPLTRL